MKLTDEDLLNFSFGTYVKISKYNELEVKCDQLGRKVSQYAKLLDDAYGTPCEQIRHEQEIAELQERIKELEAENAELKMKTLDPDASKLVDDYTLRYKELEAENAELKNIIANTCSVCGGYPVSELPCICGGTGTASGEIQGLRDECFRLRATTEESKNRS